MANEMNYEPFEYLGLTKKVTQAITDALGKSPEIVQDAIDAIDLMPEDEEGSFKYKNYRALIRTACKEIGADVPRKKYKRIEDEAEQEQPVAAPKVEDVFEDEDTPVEDIPKAIGYYETASNNKLYDICKKLTALQNEITETTLRLNQAKKEYEEGKTTLNAMLFMPFEHFEGEQVEKL